MAWIESHQELARHPKTKRLARLLGIGIPAAIGHLHLLWWWALDFAQDGDLSRHEIEDIEDAALWDAGPGVLVRALLVAGFLDRDENDRLSIHDWSEYGGALVARRVRDADRKRQWREQQKAAESTGDGPDAEAAGPSGVPYLTGPDLTGPDTTQPDTTGPDRSTGAAAPAAAPEVREVFEHFRARVQPTARICPTDKIRNRLKRFSVEELKAGIDHFAADPWWMVHNGTRGAPWFFANDARSEQFLHLSPRSEQESATNGSVKSNGYSQREHV